MGKIPASLFYWGDFLRDPDVRRCTHEEVGVWIRVLCLMFESEVKGVLQTKGVPWTNDDIAFAIGGDCNAVKQIIDALVTKGVASRNAKGSLLNRRMFREEKKRVDTKLRVQKFRRKGFRNENCNAVCNANDMPCTETETETETEKALKDLKTKRSSAPVAEKIYAEYPRKVGRAAALKAISAAVARLTHGEGAYRFTPEEAGDFLCASASSYARSPAGMAGEYTPHPATWFNQSRYLDDPNEWNRRANGGTNGNGSHRQDKPRYETEFQRIQRELKEQIAIAEAEEQTGGTGRSPGSQAPLG